MKLLHKLEEFLFAAYLLAVRPQAMKFGAVDVGGGHRLSDFPMQGSQWRFILTSCHLQLEILKRTSPKYVYEIFRIKQF